MPGWKPPGKTMRLTPRGRRRTRRRRPGRKRSSTRRAGRPARCCTAWTRNRSPRPRLAELEPPADLAEQLRTLLGQLARTQGELGALRERFEAEASQTALLRLEVKK